MMKSGQILWLVAGLLLGQVAGAGDMAARDARTGAAVEAKVTLIDGSSQHTVTVHGGLTAVATPAHAIRAVARAPGYEPLHFTLASSTLPVTLLLDPASPPAQFTALGREMETLGNPDARWIQGFVRNDATGAPVADAEVSIAGRRTMTDATGYFQLRLPPCTPNKTEGGTLLVQSTSLGSQRHEGMACLPGIHRTVIALGGSTPATILHTLGARDRGHGNIRNTVGPEQPELARTAPLARPMSPAGALIAPDLDPPDSIRVGFDNASGTAICCVGSCSYVVTMSLETYVARGLNDEWIAGWNQDSLRAGSVAYRSYGAYHVFHPRSSYDICSNACCQVNEDDTSSSTDEAVARTAGIMLTYDDTEPARSEYSAENNSWDDRNDTLGCSNNDLSCGNGYVGSPNTGWPCLHDSVAAGHGCFGHGRGMSQWGTYRWGWSSNGSKLWPWMVDHYYNANGNGSGLRTAVMTSPIKFSSVTPVPASLEPGQSFTVHANVENLAAATHQHLLMGASLYASGSGYIDDSSHDKPFDQAPGSGNHTRLFDVPASTAGGTYDLLVSVYLDVDENDSISGDDLALTLVTLNNAVQVIDDRIFDDGFE